MTAPILTTKLQIPPPRGSLVSRPRLIEALDQALDPAERHKLTVVSAPAGFGKTTLLGEWLHHLQARAAPTVQVAWLALDEGDNDPARFAAYLAAALQVAESGARHAHPAADAGEETGARLPEPHLVRLINRVAARPRLVVLVLDDYHLIVSAEIHDAVTFVLDHLPDNLHLVLATRADPPLPLPRLRARGQLVELRERDLRFSTQEAAAFLQQAMGLALSAADVAALETRTDGWIAGLQMAALAMQAAPAVAGEEQDPSEFIRAFTGSHRFVLDYLTEEVLQRQAVEVQEFLLRTSILDRMCAPLCDAVLAGWKGRRVEDSSPQSADLSPLQSSTLLAHLDRANLFIVPLDQERRWYRYHRLFADLLRRRLGQSAPELVPELHRRASAWYEQEGLAAEAIEHALAARDFGQAARLVEASVEATLMRSEVVTFLHWVERLPDAEVRAHPSLSFYQTWALLMNGRPADHVERRLQELAGAEDPSLPPGTMAGRVAALRAYLAAFQFDTRRAAGLSRQALELLPGSDQFLRSIMTWILSLARMDTGGLQDGQEALTELVSKGRQTGNRLITVTALCHQGRLQTRQGRLRDAGQTYEQALQAATDAAGRRLPIASEALIGLGELKREWNLLDAATDHLAEGIRLANQWSEMAAFDAYIPLMRARLAQGDVAGARQSIETARHIARRSEATRVDDLVVEMEQAYFCIVRGDEAGAMSWAQRRGLLAGPGAEPETRLNADQELAEARLRKYEHLVLARLFLLQGRAAQALDVLDPLLALARRLERVDLAVEIQVLRALAHQAAGRQEQAMSALGQALSLAEPGGYVQAFYDARLMISDFGLWIASPQTGIDLEEKRRLIDYAHKLLAAFPGQSTPLPSPIQNLQSKIQNPAEPLSLRELEVLRLLATGLSNPEIAGRLVVEVSTVRSHCKSIYSKLDVHKRWDAVQRAQELGLI